jgi:hypothetical protein
MLRVGLCILGVKAACPVPTAEFQSGTRYASRWATALWVRSFRKKELVMRKTELYKPDAGAEPQACFATDAEIEIADKLRHQLEERYLASTVPASPSQQCSGEDR